MSKSFLFQIIQFSISTQFSYIWSIDRTLSGATTLGQRGPGSDGIPQSSSITGNSPSDCLVSYLGHSLIGESYSSTEKQSVYSTAPAEWATRIFVKEGCLTPLQRSSRGILQPPPPADWAIPNWSLTTGCSLSYTYKILIFSFFCAPNKRVIRNSIDLKQWKI